MKPLTAVSRSGVTLVELMVVVAVLAIIATIAYPSFTAFFDRYRLQGALYALHADMQWARTEAVKSNRPVCMQFASGATWSWSLHHINCNQTDTKTESSTEYGATVLTADGWLATGAGPLYFQPWRGQLTDASRTPVQNRIVFQSGQGLLACVHFNPMGRTHLCSPAGGQHLSGVPTCDC